MRDRRKPLLPERPSETACGPVKGTEEGSLRIWYGIPYAKAPERDLRWQAPEGPEGWSEVLDCTSPADPAIQFSNNEVTGTEDCLNLDIYAADGAQKQPVLVYVHGGNNQTGTSQEIPGVDLVTNDGCVYVSLSYRLGLFGFMCLPAFGQDTGKMALYFRHSLPRLIIYRTILGWMEAVAAMPFGGTCPRHMPCRRSAAMSRLVLWLYLQTSSSA